MIKIMPNGNGIFELICAVFLADSDNCGETGTIYQKPGIKFVTRRVDENVVYYTCKWGKGTGGGPVPNVMGVDRYEK